MNDNDEITLNIEEEIAHSIGIEDEPVLANDLEQDSNIQPFDPSQIRISGRTTSVDNILKRLKHNEINLNPDFQRMGGIWDRVKKSRLIESLLIRIPIPAFYMDASDENSWIVIDGLQRLTTLKEFVIPDDPEGRLVLHNLEFWKEYEGKGFYDLPRYLQRRIEETEITIFTVEKGTPSNVKFNIFKRINTGGVPLSGQEIRHALNLGASTEFLQQLAESPLFKQATRNSIKPLRMQDRECVLRFIAFIHKSPDLYTSKDELDTFLHEQMRELNEIGRNTPIVLEEYRQRFERAMRYSVSVLGEQAFRKSLGREGNSAPISKPLFESWTVNFDKLTDEQLDGLAVHRTMLIDKFRTLMQDIEFNNAISYSTGTPRRVHYRFRKIAEIIEETLHDAKIITPS